MANMTGRSRNNRKHGQKKSSSRFSEASAQQEFESDSDTFTSAPSTASESIAHSYQSGNGSKRSAPRGSNYPSSADYTSYSNQPDQNPGLPLQFAPSSVINPVGFPSGSSHPSVAYSHYQALPLSLYSTTTMSPPLNYPGPDRPWYPSSYGATTRAINTRKRLDEFDSNFQPEPDYIDVRREGDLQRSIGRTSPECFDGYDDYGYIVSPQGLTQLSLDDDRMVDQDSENAEQDSENAEQDGKKKSRKGKASHKKK